MAYIETEKVKEIRTAIKETFAKDGFKFSVTRRHHSEVVVVCMQSPIEFSTNKGGVNHYYLDRIENDNERSVFSIVNKIITKVTGGSYNRNAGDPGADYDCNFYIDMQIGKFDNPCKFI